MAAQSLSTGSIRVEVLGSAGAPLREAQVAAIRGAGAGTRAMEHVGGGLYSAGHLPPGAYSVVVEALGFRPVRIDGVPVRPGSDAALRVRLEPAAPPVDSVATVAYAGRPEAAAGAEWIDASTMARLPFPERVIDELTRLSSRWGPGLAAEGLPARYGSLAIEGFRLPGEWLPPGAAAAPWTPLHATGAAQLLTDPVDVEWSGSAAGLLSTYGLQPTGGTGVEAFAAASPAALSSADAFDPGALSPHWLRGGARVATSARGDSVDVALAVEGSSSEVPYWRQSSESAALAAAAAANELGAAFAGFDGADLVKRQWLSADGRLGWRVSGRSDLVLRVSGGTAPDAVAPPARAAGYDLVEGSGNRLFAGAILSSRIGRSTDNELRASLATAKDELRDAVPGGETAAAERLGLVSAGVAVGTRPELPTLMKATVVAVRDAVHLTMGSHSLKGGAEGRLGTRTVEFGQLGAPEATFADSTRFADLLGVLQRRSTALASASLDVRQAGFFVQDVFPAGSDARVTLGLRYDLDRLPTGDIGTDAEWLRLSGVDNGAARSTVGALAPRAALSWAVAPGWTVAAAAGMYAGDADAIALAAANVDQGGATVTRAIGRLTPALQPVRPDSAFEGRSLTVLGSDFRGPRTSRGSVRLTGRIAGLEVGAEGSYRRTEFLPRVQDLNLQSEPVSTDEHGRLIYGTLVKQGGLLVADPESSRRFPEYDAVRAITADGESRYAGVTFAIGHESERLGISAEYTRSRTEDDWVEARRGGFGLALPPLANGSSVRMQTSDFDVPNRISIGAHGQLPLSRATLGAAAVFRYRSGLAFTPGFPVGVDPNGDGLGGDVAFIDPGVPGMDALLAEWPCLRGGSGGFAERNSCRGDAVESLDLRASVAFNAASGLGLTAYVDALGLLESETELVDAALYHLDTDADLQQGDGTALPLVANSHFGRPLVRTSSGRRIELGLRIAY